MPFKCDVHGWMNACVGVLDHPYYAVTGRGRDVRAEGPAARHLHDRGVAREARHADADDHDRREGNQGRRVHVQARSQRDSCMLLTLRRARRGFAPRVLIFAGGLVTSTGSGLSVAGLAEHLRLVHVGVPARARWSAGSSTSIATG